jgi:hypothetical protein
VPETITTKTADQPQEPPGLKWSISTAISYAAGTAFIVEKILGIPWAIGFGAIAGVAGLAFDRWSSKFGPNKLSK